MEKNIIEDVFGEVVSEEFSDKLEDEFFGDRYWILMIIYDTWLINKL